MYPCLLFVFGDLGPDGMERDGWCKVSVFLGKHRRIAELTKRFVKHSIKRDLAIDEQQLEHSNWEELHKMVKKLEYFAIWLRNVDPK